MFWFFRQKKYSNLVLQQKYFKSILEIYNKNDYKNSI